MGYNNEFAATRTPLVFDLETAPLDNVRDYIDPPDPSTITAPKNYKKQEAIDAYIAEKREEQAAEFEVLLTEKTALDYNTARIVALGTIVDGVEDVALLRCEADEREAIRLFWATQIGRKLVGFRCREFDLPMLIQRSRYLGVKAPEIDLGRYSRSGRIVDLYDLLTFQDSQRSFAMRRSLRSFARRFGIPVTDTVDGADVVQLVKADRWGEIAAHCGSDIRTTKALAERLGVLDVKVAKPMPTTAQIIDRLRERKEAVI